MATMSTEIAPMKMAQIPKPGGDFQIVEREIPKPGAREVRIKLQACGVCHSDVLTKASGPAYNIPAFRGMKSQASSTRQARVFPNGSAASASASDGTAVRTTRAGSAGEETLGIVRT